MAVERVTFQGSLGEELAARLDMPKGPPRAYALFAHCFSCSKDVFAAKRIAGQLAANGIAVLRFDFTGLGNSEGDFSNTNFSSNVDDLLAAANHMRAEFEAPSILIGHSLGGSAVLMAAEDIAECKAVVTLGAPADPSHVTHNFADHVEEIEATGIASVELGGRPFTIKKQFLDDLAANKVVDCAANLKRALLVMHAPNDAQVSIENAAEIFGAAKHPKSFVSLDSADHLITKKHDAIYAADVLCAWVQRYLDTQPARDSDLPSEAKTVTVRETGKWASEADVAGHFMLGDQPKPVGGGVGPGPYDFVAMGLGLCTNQTLRMYADRKKLDLGTVTTKVTYDKIHVEDCEDASEGNAHKQLAFFREIDLVGDLPPETRVRLLEIADKCPVHKALEGKTPIRSSLKS